jgi:hypothetical protein
MLHRKTYWHLADSRRLPSDYEIVTSRLLHYVGRGGFAVNVPMSGFYAQHQKASPLTSDRWEEFVDPRATTYTKYVELQRDAESHVDRLLASVEDPDYQRKFVPGWIESFAVTLSPLRFLWHGLQMAAAYVGQMAPSSRIAVAALFQCGDEIRRTQRIAVRLAQIARTRPTIARQGRVLWQSDPNWQPLRRAIEHLLVTYDWGEALVALNVCIKPALDDLFLLALADRADQSVDHLDAQILRALFVDCQWHRAWTDALLGVARADLANAEAVADWVDKWTPCVAECARAAAAILSLDPATAAADALTRLRRVEPHVSGRMVSHG